MEAFINKLCETPLRFIVSGVIAAIATAAPLIFALLRFATPSC